MNFMEYAIVEPPLGAVPTRVAVVVLPPPPLLPLELEPPLHPITRRVEKASATNPSVQRRRRPPRAAHSAAKDSAKRAATLAVGVQRNGRASEGGTSPLLGPTVTMTGTLVMLELRAAEAGLKVHRSPEGRPEQDRLTCPLNPFTA